MKTAIVKRFPRPLGITSMMIQYHQSGDTTIISNAQNYLIGQWSMNNGMICGIHYSIAQLAMYIGVDPEQIKTYMRDKVLNSKIWDKENQEKILMGLLGEQLIWAMEDRMDIASQVQILQEAQGNKYVPYLTAELNKALKLRLDSSSSIQNIVRNMSGGGSTNIFNQIINANNNVQQQQQYITFEEARKILEDKSTTENTTDEAKILEAKYDIKSLPEVVAYAQGLKATDGSKLNNNELNAITDSYKETLIESPKLHHEMRREIEENIDPESEDPELDRYIEEIDTEPTPKSISGTFLTEDIKW